MMNTPLITPVNHPIITHTPVGPCRRQQHKEMQDDIRDAIESQQVPLLRVALQWRHPCSSDHSLHEAIRQAIVPAVLLLLQHKADPNVRCPCLERGCELPLQLAVSCTGYVRQSDRCQVVQALLEAGADPSVRRTDQEGNTPLHDAVRRGDVGVVQILLRYGAAVNALNFFNEAPLLLALRPAGTDFAPTVAVLGLVELLLQAGAKPLDAEDKPLNEAAVAARAAPEVRDLLERSAKWWRLRHLAWVRSRGQDNPLLELFEFPELFENFTTFF